MTKKIVIPNSLNMIKTFLNKCDGFIIGLDSFSVNVPITFSLKEIEYIVNLCKEEGKEIFITINKNIHNSELERLKEMLKVLSKVNVDGVMYYDISIVNLNRKLNLGLNLIWSQEHLTTNYATCNFWNSFGVDNVYLSSDITLNEIIDIKKNISMKVFVNVFGYLPMFASYRHLLKNYLKTFNLDSDCNSYKICKEGNKYTIIDNDLGSFVYSSNILNGIDECLIFMKYNIDYVVLNSFQIDTDDFTKIVDLFTSLDDSNVKERSNKINSMFDNVDKGFFYKETVYKVKNNE